MEEKYHIGDFGRMEFMYRFIREEKKCKGWFLLFVTITAIDKYYIEITDNSGHGYLVQKRDVKYWSKEDAKNQVEIIEK